MVRLHASVGARHDIVTSYVETQVASFHDPRHRDEAIT
jgi:hypothetical protein